MARHASVKVYDFRPEADNADYIAAAQCGVSKCDACGYRQVSVAPVGVKTLECGRCGEMRSTWLSVAKEGRDAVDSNR